MHDVRSSRRRAGSMTRLVIASVVGLAVAAAVGVTTQTVFRSWWGWIYGGLALAGSFGLTLAITGPGRRIGSALIAVAASILAAGAWWVIIGYQVPLATLEGAWLWPLAIASTLAALGTTGFAARRRPKN